MVEYEGARPVSGAVTLIFVSVEGHRDVRHSGIISTNEKLMMVPGIREKIASIEDEAKFLPIFALRQGENLFLVRSEHYNLDNGTGPVLQLEAPYMWIHPIALVAKRDQESEIGAIVRTRKEFAATASQMTFDAVVTAVKGGGPGKTYQLTLRADGELVEPKALGKGESVRVTIAKLK